MSADRPHALLTVPLCEISTSGASLLATYGLLNLAHRDGHEHPSPLVPGHFVTAVMKLNDAAHRFSAGNAIRIAVSTAYWPMVWPSAKPVNLTLVTGDSLLDLPVREPDPIDSKLPTFGPPQSAAPISSQVAIRPPRLLRTIEGGLVSNEVGYHLVSEGGIWRRERSRA